MTRSFPLEKVWVRGTSTHTLFSFPIWFIYYSNLYAKEYKKSHPNVTTGQYRVLWDNINEATCKVFLMPSLFVFIIHKL